MVFVGGCTTAKISGKGAIPLLLNQPPTKVQVVQQVKLSKMVAFDYTSAFDVSEVLSEYLIGTEADAIMNLYITVRVEPLDWLINLFTLGLAQAKHFQLTGQVIKAPEGLGSIEIPDSKTLASSSNLADLVLLMSEGTDVDGSSNMIVRIPQDGNTNIYKLIRYKSEPSIR